MQTVNSNGAIIRPKSSSRNFNVTAKMSLDLFGNRNPLGKLNAKQAELSFVKYLKTLGIANEKLVKEVFLLYKPQNLDAPIKTPFYHFTNVFSQLIKHVARSNVDLNNFS